MKILGFTLSMPNKGSWNGKWTGENNLYFVSRKVSDKTAEKVLEGNTKNNYFYSWNDGWSANVKVEPVDSKTAAKMRKASKGFYGYDWMVDSILLYQEILNSNDIKQRVAQLS